MDFYITYIDMWDMQDIFVDGSMAVVLIALLPP